MRLNTGIRLNSFEVKSGEVTYIGDYHFNLYIKDVLIGVFRLTGFDMTLTNNIANREQEINNYFQTHNNKSDDKKIKIKINIPSSL